MAGRNLVSGRFVPTAGTLIAARGILLFKASTDETDAKRQTWQDAARKVRENTMSRRESRRNNPPTLAAVKGLRAGLQGKKSASK
jgi:hypothetical protein